MAPKKSKKISLNEFLGDTTLGSWADEMESLPSAPAARSDDDQSRPGDRYGRRDDMLPPRSERLQPVREDVPLPTNPPYTAYVGNLAFDLTEADLEQFFAGSKKSVKVIRDREDKPKGFGYVEFEDLDGLKDALTKTGSSLSGRTIRVSVAEPPKERAGFGVPSEDSKFEGPWRRDGPLPDLPSRDSSRRRFDNPAGERPVSSVTEGVNDWRSNRPPRAAEPEAPSYKRKGSGFLPSDGQVGQADKEEVWSIGSKFKPSVASDELSSRFGSTRGKPEASSKEPSDGDNDWRSSARPRRSNVSPTTSTPPTPQLGRKKLELLPRSGAGSVSPSPLSSPKIGSTPPPSNASRPSPFGAAKPVDVSQREKEVLEKLERDRDANKDRLSMSRTNSRTASERGGPRTRSPPPASTSSATPRNTHSLAPSVRPTLSFANVAAKKETSSEPKENKDETDVKEIADKTADLVV